MCLILVVFAFLCLEQKEKCMSMVHYHFISNIPGSSKIVLPSVLHN